MYSLPLHKLDIDKRYEAIEQDLDPAQFFRVSRKFIVSLRASREIVMYSNSRLKILLPTYKDDEVVVSREKVNDFKQWLS
ncbi:MAG: LytTR family transcriptional regulator [Proteobacteria bacterium]|nr:MAG: LytTR family transcriptional regulator [Pseudomonadota bacterium]